jgi:molecular chaperone HscB
MSPCVSDSCRILYNPHMPADDPFALFDLPRRFDLDRAALQRAYLQRTASLHPDRLSDPIEQAEAAEQAARLNAARAQLADDERRANVLLELLGGPPASGEKTLPDGFLMEMMEVRQEMEEVLETGSPEDRRQFEQWADEQRAAYLNAVRELFDSLDDPPDEAGLREIRVQLNALRYIERMIEQLDPSHEPPM